MKALWVGLGASALLTGLAAAVYATRVEPRRYRLERLTVTAGGASPSAQPLKILHISDLHLCYPESDKIDFLRQITDEEFDLIALTGDIIENYTGLPYLRSILSRKPRLGAYAVLGNHDYYAYSMFHKTVGRIIRRFRHPRQRRNVQPLIEALEQAGFTVLRNSAVRHGQEGLHVLGVDYPTLHPELMQELVADAEAGDYIVALFHMPIHLDNIVRTGAHLALGGHTHGGQIRIPGLGAIITDADLPRREASGLFMRQDTAFHISRGLGADPRSNIRFNCPPAATVLEVVRNA